MEKHTERGRGGGGTAGLRDSARREHERCTQILHLDVAHKIRAEPRRGRRRNYDYSFSPELVERCCGIFIEEADGMQGTAILNQIVNCAGGQMEALLCIGLVKKQDMESW